VAEAPRLRIGNLTEAGQHTVWRSLWTYCTSIFGDGDPPEYRGSGTFVAVNGVSCLLTAAHVWLRMARDRVLGFVTEADHSPVWLRTATLQPKVVTQPIADEWGPDIAIVAIHAHDATRLRLEKAFYAVDRSRPAPSTSRGRVVWAITGASAHFSEFTPAEARLRNHTIIVATPTVTMHGDTDYLDVPFGETPPEGIPESWGGLSGAGLWLCHLVPGSDETQLDVVPQLSGVVFYERFDGNKRGAIRCHGGGGLRSLGYDRVA
jgi:hypothetical protein